MLLVQIELADSLEYSPGFKCSLLQNPLLQKVVQSLMRYIVDIEMNAISTNLGLKLASDDINPNVFEDFSFKNIKEL